MPLPETDTDPAPDTLPPGTSVKFDAATPVTLDENTTLHDTEAALVGDVPTNVNDDTVGPAAASADITPNDSAATIPSAPSRTVTLLGLELHAVFLNWLAIRIVSCLSVSVTGGRSWWRSAPAARPSTAI